MDFIDFIYRVWLSAMCIIIHETVSHFQIYATKSIKELIIRKNILFQHSLSQLQPLRREIRFTKLDINFTNKSVGTVLEDSIKNFRDKQMINVHAIVHEKITNVDVTTRIINNLI